jgi:hypothetical protein
MPRQVENRREDGRKRIPTLAGAVIAFIGTDGKEHRYPVIELSLSGGSFEIPARLPEMTQGAVFSGCRIVVGEIEIGIHVEIRHVTRGPGVGYECGILIFPKSDEDRNEITSLVARLSAVSAMQS